MFTGFYDKNNNPIHFGDYLKFTFEDSRAGVFHNRPDYVGKVVALQNLATGSNGFKVEYSVVGYKHAYLYYDDITDPIVENATIVRL